MFKTIITAIALVATTATASLASSDIPNLNAKQLRSSVHYDYDHSSDVASRTWTLTGIEIGGEEIDFVHDIKLRGGSTDVYSSNFDDSIRYVVREAYKRGYAAAQDGENDDIRVTSSRSKKKYEAHQATHSVYIKSVTFNGDRYTTLNSQRQRYLSKDNKNLKKIKWTYEAAAEDAYRLGHAAALEAAE